MQDRGFDETDLRDMLERAINFKKNHEPGRYVIGTLHSGQLWEVIVEPNPVEKELVVVTAYSVG